MGGSGSGSWYRWDSKDTIESQRRLDIRWMKKQGYLRAGKFGFLSWSRRGEQTGVISFRVEQDQIMLNYRQRPRGGEWEDVEEIVRFDRTTCNYGGYRMWFLCPRCWQRVAVLYGVGKYFLCRHCYELTYASQQESRPYRLLEKARKIRQRLGGSGDMTDLFPWKPKGVHWKTYNKLREESEQAKNLSWLLMGQRLGINIDSHSFF